MYLSAKIRTSTSLLNNLSNCLVFINSQFICQKSRSGKRGRLPCRKRPIVHSLVRTRGFARENRASNEKGQDDWRHLQRARTRDAPAKRCRGFRRSTFALSKLTTTNLYWKESYVNTFFKRCLKKTGYGKFLVETKIEDPLKQERRRKRGITSAQATKKPKLRYRSCSLLSHLGFQNWTCYSNFIYKRFL